MKQLFLVLATLLVLATGVLATGEGTYGNETYGNFSYGVSSSAEASFAEETTIPADTPTLFNATATTNVTIDIVTSSGVSGTVSVVQFKSSPSGVGSDPTPSLGKYLDINVDNSISSNLKNSTLKIFYSDAEVSAANLQESTLRLYRWNGSEWIKFDGAGIGGVDTSNNFIFANTSTFSKWGSFGTAVPEPVSDSGSSGGSSGGGGGYARDGLSKGSRTIDVNYGDAFSFTSKGKKHTVVILDVKEDYVKIRISSTFIDFILKKGESKNIDTDGNGLDDFKVSLNEIKKLGGNFTFTILDEQIVASGGIAEAPKEKIIEPVTEPEVTAPEVPETPVVSEPVTQGKFPWNVVISSIVLMAIITIIAIIAIVTRNYRKQQKDKESS